MANMAKCSKLGEIIPKTMEQRFKSLSLFEFQERFSNAADCLKYLADEKWGNGLSLPINGQAIYLYNSSTSPG
jgi:hypothetical protein